PHFRQSGSTFRPRARPCPLARMTLFRPFCSTPLGPGAYAVRPLRCLLPSCASTPAEAANQGIGRAVVLEIRLTLALQLRDDALGQQLAELDAPLVERVDLPDDSLREDAVLVKCYQLAQGRRRQTV